MLNTNLLENSLQKLSELQQDWGSSKDSIDNLISELNSIKSFLSPTKLNISSSASTLTPSMTAMIKCSFSIAPGTYLSIRVKTLAGSLPSSNITDSKLGVNVLPFAGCTNPANPTMNPFVFPWVCIPMLTPFIPTNPTTLLENAPITTINSKAMCTFAPGGIVSFINSGQINAKTS
ncbi:type VI secretion system PAAR-like protein IglG [Pseudofrancisella aestuarii]|uniref:Type VI secretion system PAAR-like protein IglG n=1 Tax=Pseudofrancisella aestuarii TaxID=2670347 RepID=A0ABV9TAK9_9GAMM|nr:type VI secretion system PAAR-like protein IglG [Pseudofrancisella aestuarii]